MIFVDTNVVFEALKRHRTRALSLGLSAMTPELALPTVTIGEIAYGIQKIRPEERAHRLEKVSPTGAAVFPIAYPG